MKAVNQPRRAVGVVRVSERKGREGESFISPGQQRDRIAHVCRHEGLDLVDTLDEIDVSGGTALDRRKGLRVAVEMVEQNQADVVVVAYFDRLVRSLTVQAEVLERVEKAGGRVVAADVGEVRQDTAARWLSATMLGMVSEYYRRTTGERARAAQVRAVEQGRPPIKLPPGLLRDGDEIVIDEPAAMVVREAVTMRANGETFAAIREYLRDNGIDRSYHGVQTLLSSRLLVGDIVFGEMRGEVPAIVDRPTWNRAQNMTVSRGRRPKSDRLLARLGVLRCGTCGSRMVVGSANRRGYALYRCPPVGDCQRRVTISATIAEEAVVEAVTDAVRGMKGEASTTSNSLRLVQEADEAQQRLDTAVEAFTGAGLDAEPGAVKRLARLRAERDDARRIADRAVEADQAAGLALQVDDIEDLTTEELRAVIAAVVESVTVAPAGKARGRDRLSFSFRG